MKHHAVVCALAAVTLAATVSGCGKSGGAGGGSTASASAAASGPVTLSAVPHRKAGLWKMTFTSDRAPGAIPATEICVDETSEAKMSAFSANAGRHDCSAQSITRNLDGSMTFASTCALPGGGGQISAKGTVTGSFDSAYKMDMESTASGMPVAAENGTHRMSMAGVYEGPCPAGQHGGDMTMTMPNGQKMTMPGGMGAGQ